MNGKKAMAVDAPSRFDDAALRLAMRPTIFCPGERVEDCASRALGPARSLSRLEA